MMRTVIRISVLTAIIALLCGSVALFATDRDKQTKPIKPLKFPRTSGPHFRTSDRCFACHNSRFRPTAKMSRSASNGARP